MEEWTPNVNNKKNTCFGGKIMYVLLIFTCVLLYIE